MCSCSDANKSGKEKSDVNCDGSGSPCAEEVKYKLASIKVIANATQNDVTGAKNWATVKKATDDIIIEATTTPNNQTGWGKITWSGDTGSAVPGHLNQRKLSRSDSKKLHIEAELGGVKDSLDVWVIWATVTINTAGTTPANSVQFGGIEDGTEKLGAVTFNGGSAAAGKVAPVAQITPAGINKIVSSGWSFKRDRISHDWKAGVKVGEGNGRNDYWNTAWVDDTSLASWTNLTPTNDKATGSFDQIFDLDGPTVGLSAAAVYETYNNFRQWIEWHNEKCSGYAEWYWKGVKKASANPQIITKEVGTGNIALPAAPSLP